MAAAAVLVGIVLVVIIVGASGDRGLKIALRATAAPRYIFNSCLRMLHKR